MTFTTGSSGAPKGADRTHAFLMAQHAALSDALGDALIGPELVTLPIFALHALGEGRTCVLAPIPHANPSAYSPRRMHATIKRHAPASMAASPAVLQTLVDHLRRKRQHIDAPMHLHIGGAAVTPAFMWRLRRVFPNAVLKAVYGSTEAEPIAIMDGDALAQLHGTLTARTGLPAGIPWRGTEVRIIPVHHTPIGACSEAEFEALVLPPGQIGEICVAGDHVLTHYFRQAMPATQKIRAGCRVWHRTGDAGSLNPDGCLTLFGPLSQSFVWRGESWYPLPIEVQLDALSHVIKSTVLLSSRGPMVCVETNGHVTRRRLNRSIRALGLPEWPIWLGRIPRDPRHRSKVDISVLATSVEATI